MIYIRNSNGTINRKTAALSKLITEAVKHGVVTNRMVIERLKEPKGRLKFLEPDEEQSIVGTFRLWGRDDFADLTDPGNLYERLHIARDDAVLRLRPLADQLGLSLHYLREAFNG